MDPSEKLATALKRAKEITKINKGNVVQSQQLQRADRELLIRTKWLLGVMQGWYLLIKPGVSPGESSIWYANFWDFLKVYLNYRFGKEYCLSADNSLDIHTGSTNVPKQVIVIASKGGGSAQDLPHDTSLYIYTDSKNLPEERTAIQGLQVMTLPYALCKASLSYFEKNAKEAEIALGLIRTSSELTRIIVKHQFLSAAERLIGAYHHIGNEKLEKTLKEDLERAGLKIKGKNPFTGNQPLQILSKVGSPYRARILSLWEDFRETIINCFPADTGLPKDSQGYLKHLEDLYEKDAYNSLSIEGYQVNEVLIERIQNNDWNPDGDHDVRQEKNALAARGYYEAFGEVKKSILNLFKGICPAEVIENDLNKWYQSLFPPMARAGLIREEDLFGYRRGQVYVRNSRHIPFPQEAMADSMETLFECLKKETHAAVRALLGHYIFVFIHPYMDGNGRIGRFLMNAMFVTGGYPWTIIEVKNRKQYLDALEITILERNIAPFAKFVALEMKESYI